jgi:hypothetical protein
MFVAIYLSKYYGTDKSTLNFRFADNRTPVQILVESDVLGF